MSERLFLADCAQLAADAFNAGRMSRRNFLRACAIAGVTPIFLNAGDSKAASKPAQIVHANWGGDAVKCTQGAYGEPFTQDTGVEVVIDGTGPLEGKIKAMVDAKNVTWDVCDADGFNAIRLGRVGLLEPIDYSIVDRNKAFEGFTWDYGIVGYFYTYVLAWDKSKVSANPPTWADFFDVEKYPGKRTLYKWMNGAVEAALLADGVPPDKLYPLDLERAFKKIQSIKDHLVFWGSGAESQQMFTQGEVVMGEIWHTRASVLERDTNGRVTFTWNQGNVAPGTWVVPKGNPAGGEWAMRWIASMQEPKRQIEALKCFGQGPANPATAALLPPELRRINPTEPENFKLQIPLDTYYFGEHYDDALNGFSDMISA